MGKITVPNTFKVVQGLAPSTDAAARTADYVKLTGNTRATIIVDALHGTSAAIALDVYESPLANGSGEQSLANAVRWWRNADCAATDTLVAQTPADDSFDTTTAVKNHQVVIQVDAADLSEGYEWITIKSGGAQATNLLSVTYLLETNYQQATPPTAIA